MSSDRDTALADRRAQLANNATAIFLTLNTGALAGLLTWLQTFPLAPDTYSCQWTILQRMPWVVGLLLGGIFSAAASYLVRYRSGNPGRVQIGWQLALALSAFTLMFSGAIAGWTITNCRSLSFAAKLTNDVNSSLKSWDSMTGKERIADLREMQRSIGISHARIQLSGVEDWFEDRQDSEKTQLRVKELQAAIIERQKTNPRSEQLQEQLRRLNEIEVGLTEVLNK